MKARPKEDYYGRVLKAAGYLRKHFRSKELQQPTLAVILGSGQGDLAESLRARIEIPFTAIPGFPLPSVVGHSGGFVFGKLGDTSIYCLKGRIHLYEGHEADQVVFWVRVLRVLGIERLIVVNAAGGLHRTLRPGDLMLIRDHLSMFVPNPLIGANLGAFGPRFPDMSACYSQKLRRLARLCARNMKLPLKEGVYVAVSGPSYETPAEVKMLRKLGADAVGMSTVPEVIVARHMGIECLGISCITNLAAGVSKTPLSHDEVLKVGKRITPVLTEFLDLLAGAILQSDAQ